MQQSMAIIEKKSAVMVATLFAMMLPLHALAQIPAQPDPNLSTNAKIAADTLHGPITDDEFKLPLDNDTAAKVDAAIGQLGSPEYKKREDATISLIEIGAPAFSKLREAYLQSGDVEVRQRIERITRTAYLNYYVLDQFGYLGIQMGGSNIAPNGQKTPGQPAGIRVGMVMPNSGASRAGLRVEDVIIAIDGTPLAENGLNEVGKFSEQIRSRRPGTKMKLTALRGGTQLELEPTLGRAPTETARKPDNQTPVTTITVTSEYARLAEDRFEAWWPKYFNPHGTHTTSATPAKKQPQPIDGIRPDPD